MLQNFLVCGTNKSETVDFYSLNAYEWCGDSSYTVSGYDQLQKNATDYPVPIFFSETGCNTVPPRTFGDQAAILGSEMDNTWSGAIIYEWIEETNNYGLVNYGSSGAVSGTPTPMQPDFSNLAGQWATLTPAGVQLSAYSASASSPAVSCPAYTSDGWKVDPNSPLPTLGQTLNRDSPSTTSLYPTGGATKSGMASGASGSASASASASGSGAKKADAAGRNSGLSTLICMGAGLMGLSLAFVVWL